MNYAEVKSLLDAGFTVDEIRSIGFPQNPQNNSQEPKKEPVDPDKKPVEPAQVEPEPKDAETPPDPVEEKFNQLTGSIEKLIKTIQVSNLNRTSMDTNNNPADIDKQVDSIMAGLIRPEKK